MTFLSVNPTSDVALLSKKNSWPLSKRICIFGYRAIAPLILMLLRGCGVIIWVFLSRTILIGAHVVISLTNVLDI